MSEPLPEVLRRELAEMARLCTTPMGLWDRFSHHVLDAANTLAIARVALEQIAEHPGPNADEAAHMRQEIALDALKLMGPSA